VRGGRFIQGTNFPSKNGDPLMRRVVTGRPRKTNQSRSRTGPNFLVYEVSLECPLRKEEKDGHRVKGRTRAVRLEEAIPGAKRKKGKEGGHTRRKRKSLVTGKSLPGTKTAERERAGLMN